MLLLLYNLASVSISKNSCFICGCFNAQVSVMSVLASRIVFLTPSVWETFVLHLCGAGGERSHRSGQVAEPQAGTGALSSRPMLLGEVWLHLFSYPNGVINAKSLHSVCVYSVFCLQAREYNTSVFRLQRKTVQRPQWDLCFRLDAYAEKYANEQKCKYCMISMSVCCSRSWFNGGQGQWWGLLLMLLNYVMCYTAWYNTFT